MRIRQKLLAGFLFISLVIFGFSFGINLLVQEKTFSIFSEVSGEILPGDIAVSRMTTELYRTVILLDKYEQSRDIEIRKEIEHSLSALDVHKTMHRLYHKDDELEAQIDEMTQMFSSEVARYNLLLLKNAKSDEISKVKQNIDSLLERFLESLNPAIDQSISSSYQKIADVRKMNRDSHMILLAGGIIIFIFILFLSVYITQRFSNPLRELRDAAQQVGSGQLNISLPVNSEDEIGDVARAFNKMATDLKDAQKELQAKHQALQNNKNSLEELIYSRTKELQKSNLTLKNTIEELNSTQEQLIESEKMTSLGGIVSGVAKKINTPLGVCITSASTIEDELKQLLKNFKNDKITQKILQDYIQKTEKFSQLLTNNLLSIIALLNSFKQVTIEQEQYNIDWRVINLRDSINDVVSNMKDTLSEHNVSVNNRCNKDITLYTSAGVIQQILRVLITNSLSHAFEPEQDGQIVINAQKYTDYILIDYHDNGKGISDQHKSLIFEPFYTTKEANTNHTGLGLSIIYNLISRTLHGHIKVQSQVNEGTNFYIELPLISKQTSE